MRGFVALTSRELEKWYKDPFVFSLTLIQPIIWMVLFGRDFNFSTLIQGMSGASFFQEIFGTSDYFSYMAVGMLPFVVVFMTMVSGMSVVWDRRAGFLAKVLSTPVRRSSIILSKVFSTIVRTLVQAVLVFVAALALGLHLGVNFNPLMLVGVFAALVLLSIGLSSIFITIAIRSRNPETPVALMNLLNLPLLFASNALFPLAYMPDWIYLIASVNPITYATDAARQLLLYEPFGPSLGFDFLFLGGFALLFGGIGLALSHSFLSK
nr:ABC transporter permease [Candidatus Njordarchaeota archaeon]